MLKRGLLLFVLLSSFAGFATSIVVSSGDPFDIHLERGRHWAIEIVKQLDETQLELISPDNAWFLEHRDELARDLRESKWTATEVDFGACARTAHARFAAVEYNRNTCRAKEGLVDVNVAAELVIHETLHHFGIQEAEAKKTARALMQVASKSRKLSSVIKVEKSKDVTELYPFYEDDDYVPIVWTFDRKTKSQSVYSLMSQPGSFFIANSDASGLAKLDTAHAAGQWEVVNANREAYPLDRSQFSRFVYFPAFVWSGDLENEKAANWIFSWGGAKGNTGVAVQTSVNTGFLFHTKTRELSAIPSQNAPAGRVFHSATMLGDRMFVWGGLNRDTFESPFSSLNDGALFDFEKREWVSLPTMAGWVPDARFGHSAVSTENEVLIWGGCNQTNIQLQCIGQQLSNGAKFDKKNLQWKQIAQPSFFIGVYEHKAIWTGSKMIVWGGFNSEGREPDALGGIYDPTSDTWTPIEAVQGIPARVKHELLWTGSELAIVGGSYLFSSRTEHSILLYNPETKKWRDIRKLGEPSLFFSAKSTAVWTGLEFVVNTIQPEFEFDSTMYTYLVNPNLQN